MLNEDVAELLVPPFLLLQGQGPTQFIIGEVSKAAEQVPDAQISQVAADGPTYLLVGHIAELPDHIAQGLGHVQPGGHALRIFSLFPAEKALANEKRDDGVEFLLVFLTHVRRHLASPARDQRRR